ncbi:cuticle protein AM1199-like [Macrobrachium nipponense]|uniref:cuticle protein AM1199-like n=1 Tax=Macrobrachium nipponense TaxID=159736 RepID=UPI0030C8323C
MQIFSIATILLVSQAARTHAFSLGLHAATGGSIQTTPIPILVDERTNVDSLGGYGFRIQTGNGISWSESAAPIGPLGQPVTNGAYSFTHPDGTVHHMTYTADAAGFHPVSNMIPTPFPLEPWQLEQVRFAEEQRRLQEQSGVTQ